MTLAIGHLGLSPGRVAWIGLVITVVPSFGATVIAEPCSLSSKVVVVNPIHIFPPLLDIGQQHPLD